MADKVKPPKQPARIKKSTVAPTSTSSTITNAKQGGITSNGLFSFDSSNDGEGNAVPVNLINGPGNQWQALNIFQSNIEKLLEQKFREQDEKRLADIQTHQTKNKKPNIELSFKYKNNKVQYKFLQELNENLDEAKDLLQMGSKKRLGSTLDEMSETIAKRQKIIRLADKSPAGWDTVNEYLQDELASDSDDDKKIRQAEHRAMAKKRKSDQSSKQKTSGTSKSFPRFQPQSVATAPLQMVGNTPFNQQRFSFPFTMQPMQQQVVPKVVPIQQNPANVCFECGLPGHWRHSCPNKQKGMNVYNPIDPTSKVKGNLKKHVDYWENILKANEFILNIIRFGYRIPFRYLPPPFEMKNNKIALKEKEFVEESVLSLIKNHFVREVNKPEFTSPLSVAYNSKGKKRLILDLSYLNHFIWKEKIKFDDLRIFENFIDSDSKAFLFKFDLKSGYFHVDIHKDFQKYLGFSWIFKDGRKKYFQYTVLPFGLTSAPFIFTKIVRVLIRYWRSFSIKIACFIDDGLAIEYSKEKATQNSSFVKNSLQLSGFVDNSEKSQWDPLTRVEWLGTVIDFENKTYSITEQRIDSLLDSINSILKSPSFVSARKLACVAGKIISTKFVFGNIVRLKTRFLYKAIESRISWDKKFSLVSFGEVVNEILFWKLNTKNLNKRPIIKYEIPELKIYSDASGTGIAAVFDENVCYRNLNFEEKNEHSTYRELLAILHAIESFEVLVKGRNLLWHTDNFSAAIIVRIGSNKCKLHDIATKIYDICRKKEITLTVTWISRKLNSLSDKISKTIDYDDWTISSLLFNKIYLKWGPFSIDLFADNKNSKCKRFCSKYWCPGTMKVDAFSFDWSNENCLMVPPTFLIARCVKHFLACKGNVSGVLIVPFWPSATFWPFLVNEKQNFKEFIKEYLFFPSTRELLLLGEFKGSLMGSTENEISIFILRLEK